MLGFFWATYKMTSLRSKSQIIFPVNSSMSSKLYFVSFAVTNWIGLFVRDVYRDILIDSIKHCQATKDLELYGCGLMTSHVHLIIGSSGNALSNILRDLKRHTSEELHKAIANNKT